MEGSTSTTYIEIPLDFTYSLPAGNNNIKIYAGPYLGYLLAASDTEIGDDAKDAYKSTELGLNIGASFEFGHQANQQRV